MVINVARNRRRTSHSVKVGTPAGNQLAPNSSAAVLLDKEIRFFPGLPYASWHEIAVATDDGPWQMLSADEERLLFRQMNLAWFRASQLRDAIRNGDLSTESTAEFQRLVERAVAIRDKLLRSFYKLNLSIAGRLANACYTFDELTSEGQLTLLRAISRFDPERGFRFSTYAMHAIRRRLLRYIRTRHRERQAAGVWTEDAAAWDTRRWTLAYEQRITTATAAAERLLAQLSARERFVVRSRYGWGWEFEPRTLREIAQELGVSRERVRQLEERALRKLRRLAKTLDVEL